MLNAPVSASLVSIPALLIATVTVLRGVTIGGLGGPGPRPGQCVRYRMVSLFGFNYQMCSPSLLLSSRGRGPRLGAVLLQPLALLLGTAGAGPLVAAGLGSGLGPLGRA